MTDATPPLRRDLAVVADLVTAGSKVLDVGCGKGALLALLGSRKGVDGRGIELKQSKVAASVARGLSVIQGDADTDLVDYPDGAFDFVILSQTVHAVRRPLVVLQHMLRIGAFAIVSFPNVAVWHARLKYLWRGSAPITYVQDESWYGTASIHPCSIADFIELCRANGVAIVQGHVLGRTGGARPIGPLANLCAEQAIFLLKRA